MTLICDSMAKHISGIRNTVVQAFPGVNITQLQQIIKAKKASINYKYTILLVGDIISLNLLCLLYQNQAKYNRQ